MTKTATRGVWAVGMAALTALAGCAGEHARVVSATGDLACEPSALRSAWWSEGGPFYGGTGEVTFAPDGAHVVLEDMFRSTAIALSDGTRSEGGQLTVDLVEAAGLRFATPRMQTDAEGRSDYAGATDVFAIGTPTPLASIPWIEPHDVATGYTQVAAHVSQTTDRAYLVERAVRFGTPGGSVWLRSVRISDPRDEVRVDLAATLPADAVSYQSPFSILADETRGVVFVTIGRQVDASPTLVRVELASGHVTSVTLTLGAPADVLGIAHVGEPGTRLLEVALASGGQALFVTTRDGLLHELDAETLLDVAPPTSVGIVVANADTYLPSLQSPVATSSHDELLAMLDDMGRVVVVDATSGARLATLASAAPLVRDIDLNTDRAPRPMMVRFLPDGLLVVTETGVERFGCPG